MRAWTCFGVTLETECRRIGALDTLKRSIEQRFVRCLEVGRKRVRVDREAMVLACDQHAVVAHDSALGGLPRGDRAASLSSSRHTRGRVAGILGRCRKEEASRLGTL